MKVLKHIFAILLLNVFVSCSDFLERPPLDRIRIDDYWKTARDLESYIFQFYPGFPGHGTGNVNGYGYPVDDSDEVILGSPSEYLNGVRGITPGRWIADWREIRSINIFFDNYRKCRDDFASYRHFLGEAYFFRAWFYFKLLQKYGDIPWISSELNIGSEELTQPRTSRTAVVDSMLADLGNATAFLNLRRSVGNSRLNKEAALAFKARIALYEGTWQKYHAGTVYGTEGADYRKYLQVCVDAAEELINGSDYIRGIYNTGQPTADYYQLFGMENMSGINEILFYRAYNATDGLRNNVQTLTTNLTGGRGLTWELVSSYLGKDGNPYDYLGMTGSFKGNEYLDKLAEDIDPRLHATVWMTGDLRWGSPEFYFDKPSLDQVGIGLNPTGFQLKKCSNPYASGSNAAGGNSETGYILFRYGEVLLNYAEARYELDGQIAQQELDLLRARAGMPEFKVVPRLSDPNPIDYGYELSDALYEIRRERRVELALEGHRTDDLKRWAAHHVFKNKRPKGYPFDRTEFPTYNPPLDENGLIDYFQRLLPNGYQFRENRDYLDPIPIEELTLNPALKQNPGW
ncbi:MAG: glycan metabolism protein RagB [Cytophagaceae bacterium SCN 52-12]|nr:MAG: glycan metabolism protein RagB [Cytophagaceae bacterium SCN 52-12]